jgi:hypothetical protein
MSNLGEKHFDFSFGLKEDLMPLNHLIETNCLRGLRDFKFSKMDFHIRTLIHYSPSAENGVCLIVSPSWGYCGELLYIVYGENRRTTDFYVDYWIDRPKGAISVTRPDDCKRKLFEDTNLLGVNDFIFNIIAEYLEKSK